MPTNPKVCGKKHKSQFGCERNNTTTNNKKERERDISVKKNINNNLLRQKEKLLYHLWDVLEIEEYNKRNKVSKDFPGWNFTSKVLSRMRNWNLHECKID